MHIRRGTEIRDYTVGKRLGEGGFASVYRGGREDDTQHALKISPTGGSDEKYYQNELLRLRQLQGVDSVIRLIDAFDVEIDETLHHCLVLELADMDLHSVADAATESQSLLDRDEAVNIMRQVIDAVEALHNRGLVHTDIKPENILRVDRNGVPVYVLADLGSCIGMGRPISNNCGTSGYTPPEKYYDVPFQSMCDRGLITGDAMELSWSYGIDIWEMACTFWRTFTGKHLFDLFHHDVDYGEDLDFDDDVADDIHKQYDESDSDATVRMNVPANTTTHLTIAAQSNTININLILGGGSQALINVTSEAPVNRKSTAKSPSSNSPSVRSRYLHILHKLLGESPAWLREAAMVRTREVTRISYYELLVNNVNISDAEDEFISGFVDFIEQCIKYGPFERPSIAALKAHPVLQ